MAGPSLSWPYCGPRGAAELLSAQGTEHGSALHGGRQRGGARPPCSRPPGPGWAPTSGPGVCCSTQPAAGPVARTCSSASFRPRGLGVPAGSWELRDPPSCSPGPGARCEGTSPGTFTLRGDCALSKKTEARRTAVGRPQGTNGWPQNNRSRRKEDSWRSAGLISAVSAYSAGARERRERDRLLALVELTF